MQRKNLRIKKGQSPDRFYIGSGIFGSLYHNHLHLPVKLVTLLASPQDAVTLAAAVDTSKKMAVRLICRGQSVLIFGGGM